MGNFGFYYFEGDNMKQLYSKGFAIYTIMNLLDMLREMYKYV